MRSQITKHTEYVVLCDDCLQHFSNPEKYAKHQKECRKRVTYVPSIDKSILEFSNYNNKLDVPFVIYADSECIFENFQTCAPKGNVSSTTLIDKHIPYAFSYYIKCSFDDRLNKLLIFKGLDSPRQFVKSLLNDVLYLHKNLKKKK